MRLPSGNKITALGIMSGTSLDGMDMALVEFERIDGKWQYNVVKAETIEYSKPWLKHLEEAHTLDGEALTELHHQFGRLIGEYAKNFLQNHPVDLIASHGQTIFHQPEKGFTLQIGSGAQIATITHKMVISDFRSLDVALDGQGAPLVPIGDRYLFSEYDYCLNLGGFANISFEKNNQRNAYDITATNFVLNHLSQKLGKPYDENGNLGAEGFVDGKLLHQLNQLEFYQQPAPKSLGREWVESSVLPILKESTIPIKDQLRTFYEHIAIQIANNIEKKGKLLITGGGAYNTFLISLIKKYSNAEVVIPSKELIEFKEAIIFAFLGVLRFFNINNTLSSVTGAKKDSCGGVINYSD